MGILDLLIGQLFGGIVPASAIRKLIDEVKAEVLKIQAAYPGAATEVLAQALLPFLEQKLAPYANVELLEATLGGVAFDIFRGTAGTDPDAWSGA